MIDPHLVLMLLQILGKNYIVWDKSAAIKFIAPGKSTVYANIIISAEQIEDIKSNTADEEPYRPTYTIDIIDEEEKLIAQCEKTLYIKRKTT